MLTGIWVVLPWDIHELRFFKEATFWQEAHTVLGVDRYARKWGSGGAFQAIIPLDCVRI